MNLLYLFKRCLKAAAASYYALYKHYYVHQKKRWQVFALARIEDRFTKIYELNYWDNAESRSGSGSTLQYTENLRRHLPHIFAQFGIRSILDAPCGDFNWMRHVLAAHPLPYTGVDIVGPLIEANSREFGTEQLRFAQLDITRETLPTADLMVCRDCLFHLSFDEVRAVVRNFLDSNIPYLLTTTHINNGHFGNFDIPTGDYRLIDLFAAPFNFPPDVLYRIADWQHPEPPREMCLWHRDQIAKMARSSGYGAVAGTPSGKGNHAAA